MPDLGFIRVAAVCPPVKVADVFHNVEASIVWLRKAAAEGATLAVLPELGLTGYTCGDLFNQHTLLRESLAGLSRLAEQTRDLGIAAAVGLPLEVSGRLYNCAAFLSEGEVKGIVPKQYLPNAQEYYERRWFTPALGMEARWLEWDGGRVPFGPGLVFHDAATGTAVGIEVCEDLWAVEPPSGGLCLSGANLILNLSASNEILGKAPYRRMLVQQQSARGLCAYAYASAGPGESTTDVVFSGHCLVAENGTLLAESGRFLTEGSLTLADVDLDRITHDRIANTSFTAVAEPEHLRVPIRLGETKTQAPLRRPNPVHPFVPSDAVQREATCLEIFSIQTAGLEKRLRHTGVGKLVIGVSGGLDSTLALLVAVATFNRIGKPLSDIVAVTMPGFGTTSRTEGNATRLAEVLGNTLFRIDITKAVSQHFEDIGHPPDKFDVTYENAQARERTQVLMDLSNRLHGLVLGTGDLSEAALGWCTFNGDHMSMYHVNAGVPKTLVRYLVQWCAETEFSGAPGAVLADILATPISPELLPLDEHGEQRQATEDTLGPYELHDFFLYHIVRFGATPEKVLFLAEEAFAGRYGREEIVRWLQVFHRRFFSQQFKRSSMPDGPKVGSVALSPRGDWRMPSDAEAKAWLSRLDKLSNEPKS
jgi:NAD+ synthase (glutamine-hydrolysing)